MENSINYNALERNLFDIIQEAQIKIGYDRHEMKLYYPVESVNHLLDTELSGDALTDALRAFCETERDKLGAVTFSYGEERISFQIPAEGVQYVHEKVADNGFLRALIDAVSKPCTIDDILRVFHAYSDRVVCRKMESSEEFDYLVYFEDGEPDAFWYCLQFECAHAVYHRFMPKDYQSFGFE